MKRTLQLLILCTYFSTTQAALLVYEPFEFGIGLRDGDSFIGVDTGAIGLLPWENGKTGTPLDKHYKLMSAPYSDGEHKLAISGSAAYLDGNQQFVEAKVDAPMPMRGGDVLYVSFMVNKLGDYQPDGLGLIFDQNSIYALFHPGTERKNGEWSLKLNVGKSPDDFGYFYSDDEYEDVLTIGKEYFVVMKIEFHDQAKESISIAINPRLSEEPTWSFRHLEELGTTLGSIIMHAPGADTTPPPGADLMMDEIRIGTSYNDVTPIESPNQLPRTFSTTLNPPSPPSEQTVPGAPSKNRTAAVVSIGVFVGVLLLLAVVAVVRRVKSA